MGPNAILMSLTQQSDAQDSFCPASLKETFSTNTNFAIAIYRTSTVSKDFNQTILELQSEVLFAFQSYVSLAVFLLCKN